MIVNKTKKNVIEMSFLFTLRSYLGQSKSSEGGTLFH